MKIIKLIINWIINLFKKIFGGNSTVNKKIKTTINNQSNKRYLKGYEKLNIDNESDVVSFPLFLEISNLEKEEILKKINEIEKKINIIIEKNNLVMQKTDVDNVKKSINNMQKKLKNKKISVYQAQQITEKVDNILMDKKIEVDTSNKVISLEKEVVELLENYDKNIKEKTKKEYKVVNYITINTLLLEETEKEIRKLEEDFRHHRYNKYYYEREIEKIKERLESIRKLRDKDSVRKEILYLRKELYTKSKDKYDLLYNDEIYYSFKKNCDDLLKKVNRRIIDLKKEKEEEEKKKKEKEKEKEQKKEEPKTKEDKKEEKEKVENILRRFQDVALAEKILSLMQNKYKDYKEENIFNIINELYSEFIDGEKCKFNYERNKIKLELVKFLNGLNSLYSLFTHEGFIPFEHINFSMTDLIEYSMIQKEELENLLLVKYNYQKEQSELSILVDNKLSILMEREEKKEDKPHILVKTNNENRS